MSQITEEDLRKIAAEVEREYETGGLSGGTLYEDFAVDVAKRAISMERKRCAEMCRNIYAWPGATRAGVLCENTTEACAKAIESGA